MSQELVAAARDGDLLKLEADLDRVFASLPITLALDSLVFPPWWSSARVGRR